MIKITPKNHELFSKARILFKIRSCGYCRLYDEFIETINAKLPIGKRITIIDCTDYHDFKIITDSRIPIFEKYIEGSYPCLFIDGIRIQGSNSREELEAFVKSLLSEDFIINEDLVIEVEDKDYPIQFNQDCHYEKKGFFRRHIVCR